MIFYLKSGTYGDDMEDFQHRCIIPFKKEVGIYLLNIM